MLRIRTVVAAFCLTGALLLPASPAGATTKPFSLVVSPSSFSPGSTVTATATLTNLTSQQQLGSANITAPAGFVVTAASVPAPAAATVSGSTVQVRNASLAPNQSLAVSITVTAPCTAVNASWSVIAKQSNDFNGPPGNNLDLSSSASSLSASVSSACVLRFATQPQSARTGQVLSGTAYTPSGPPVAVQVTDGSGNVVDSSAAITVQIGPTSTGTGTLSGTKTVNAVHGAASFGNLSINQSGAYVLRATSPGITSATSTPFRIDDIAVVCNSGLDCSGSINSRNLGASVTAFSGGLTPGGDFLTFSLDNGPAPDCPGYTELSPDWVVLDATSPTRTKTATLTIPKQLMNATANNGASFLQLCFGSPAAFTTKPGTPLVTLNVDVDGDGVPDNWYEGLLPDCGSSFPPPCVSSRNKTGSGDGVIVANLPAGSADPHMRG